MPVRVSCSACPSVLLIPESLLGKSVQCAKCGATFRAPPPDEPEVVEPIPDEPREAAPRRRREREEPRRREDAPRRRDRDEDEPRRPSRRQKPTGLPLGWLVGGAAALLLLVVGGGIAAWLALSPAQPAPVGKQVAAKDGKTATKDRTSGKKKPPEPPPEKEPEKKEPEKKEPEKKEPPPELKPVIVVPPVKPEPKPEPEPMPPPVPQRPTGTTLVAEPTTTGADDPLPLHAVRRLGSTRWRSSGVGKFVLLPDGLQAVATRLLGNEHRYLDTQTGATVKTVANKTAGAVTFSPDGKQYLASLAGGPQLCDAATGAPIRQFPSAKVLLASAFAADGKWLALVEEVAFQKNTVAIVEVATSRQVWMADVADTVVGLTFAPDGRFLAAVGSNGGTTVWETADGKPVGQFATEQPQGQALVAFTADGKQVIVAANRQVYLWDTSTRGKPDSVRLAGPVLALARDGRLLAFSMDTRTSTALALWDVSRRRVTRYLPSTVGRSDGGAFSADGRTLAVEENHSHQMMFDSKLLRVWNVETGVELSATTGHRCPVVELQFTTDGGTLVASDSGATTRYWKVADGSGSTLYAGGYTRPARAVSADGKVALLSGEKGYGLHELERGPRPGTLADRLCWSAAFAPDGKQLAVLTGAGLDNHVKLFDASNVGAAPRAVKLETTGNRVLYSPNGKWLATGSTPRGNTSDKETRIVDATSAKAVHKVAGRPFAFTTKGHLVTAEYKTVTFWDPARGTEVSNCKVELENGIESLAISPDGKYLAVGGQDEVVLVTGTGTKELARLKGHRGNVYALAFAPDSKTLASGGEDTSILLWDLAKIGK